MPAKQSSIREVAERHGVHPTTLYRWVSAFQKSGGRISALAPSENKCKGQTRLDPRVEAILADITDKYFLTEQRRSITSVWDDLDDACQDACLDTPHVNTLRNRIERLSKHFLIARRFGTKVAREQFGQLPSSFKGAIAPHALVQADHTKVDIILLDEDTRLPIGRPWITVVLDVYSRAVLGFYVSLDPPSTLSIGLALVRAVLPKGPWLNELGLDLEWPCQGLIGCLYVDNALELNGSMILRTCLDYGIDLQNRPLGKPDFGGHVERFMRTLADAVHALPGTTFSNVAEKRGYDSAAHACMTLRELEVWLAQFIGGVYHNRPHKGLKGQTPRQCYEGWFREQGEALGIKGASLPGDERRFRIDFLPFVERTIQRSGVEMHFGTVYFDDVLRPFVGEKSPEAPTKGRKFQFAYDPRDLSIIYFWHPMSSEYVPIPRRNGSKRPQSLWELRRQTQQKAAEDPQSREIARRSRKVMKGVQDEAQASTQKVRREAERAKQHRAKNIHTIVTQSSPNPILPDGDLLCTNFQTQNTDKNWDSIEPFLDIE
jgi:putative transposase